MSTEPADNAIARTERFKSRLLDKESDLVVNLTVLVLRMENLLGKLDGEIKKDFQVQLLEFARKILASRPKYMDQDKAVDLTLGNMRPPKKWQGNL